MFGDKAARLLRLFVQERNFTQMVVAMNLLIARYAIDAAGVFVEDVVVAEPQFERKIGSGEARQKGNRPARAKKAIGPLASVLEGLKDDEPCSAILHRLSAVRIRPIERLRWTRRPHEEQHARPRAESCSGITRTARTSFGGGGL